MKRQNLHPALDAMTVEEFDANPPKAVRPLTPTEECEWLRAENGALLTILMTQTRLCPFGGGRDGKRESCRYGHPGCACQDWLDSAREIGALDGNQ